MRYATATFDTERQNFRSSVAPPSWRVARSSHGKRLRGLRDKRDRSFIVRVLFVPNVVQGFAIRRNELKKRSTAGELMRLGEVTTITA